MIQFRLQRYFIDLLTPSPLRSVDFDFDFEPDPDTDPESDGGRIEHCAGLSYRNFTERLL